MTKHEAALAYASQGWKVFPCAPNTKTPMAGVSHGVKDATDSADRINEWWTKCPDANIGLACGSASGVYVVDIDIRPKKGVDGFRSIKDSGKKLVATRSQNTPSGGMHLLYRCSGERPFNKNGFLEGVDIRSDGYYIVVAPSVIDGHPYEWRSGHTEMEEFPEDFRPARPSHVAVFTAIPERSMDSGSTMTERAKAYLAQIPGAVEGLDGHAKLFWVAQVLVNGFRLPDSEVEELLWNEYNPRCVPPWTRSRSTEKEFRHKIEESHRKPNPEACAIYEAVGEESPLDEFFSYEECIRSIEGMLRKPSDDCGTPPTRGEAEMTDLYTPEGLVGDVAKWITDTAPCYQPLFALGASLVLCGTVMGRKVRDESDQRTNIYCMGIGPSSCGKDHPGDCINKILTSAGCEHLMMGRMTCDTAIEKALAVQPYVKVSIMDEVGHFFSNINRAGEGSSYLKTIKPCLMELFSSAHKTYLGKEKTGNERTVRISQPCMCLWGVTVPDNLYAGMTIEELQDGWIARNLLFIAKNEIPDIVSKPMSEVPDGIKESVRAWVLRSTSDLIITGDPGGSFKPITVTMDSEARMCFEGFNREARENMRSAMKSGDKTQALWGKAYQNARRIALIVACGREFENPVITHYDARYGCRLVRYLINNTIRAIENNVVETKWESDKNRLCKIVLSNGNDGMKKTDITRRSQWLKDKRTRNEYLDDLEEAGRIFVLRSGPDGKTGFPIGYYPPGMKSVILKGIEKKNAEGKEAADDED